MVTEKILWRRQVVFLVLSGLFLGTLTMLNILGVTKIIDLSFGNVPFILTMGVLPYPITFLCTDFISELYGRKKANLVVWVGLILNIWVLFVLWLGNMLPSQSKVPVYANQEVVIPADTLLPKANAVFLSQAKDGKIMMLDTVTGVESEVLTSSLSTSNPKKEPARDYVFSKIIEFTFASVLASMIAYLVAQFCDVRIFHFLKRKTKGKHLWLRNNGSTLISQLIDSFSVILIAHYAADAFQLRGKPGEFEIIMTIILSGYTYKLVSALIDTVPFYVGTKYLSKYLQIDPNEGYSDE